MRARAGSNLAERSHEYDERSMNNPALSARKSFSETGGFFCSVRINCKRKRGISAKPIAFTFYVQILKSGDERPEEEDRVVLRPKNEKLPVRGNFH